MTSHAARFDASTPVEGLAPDPVLCVAADDLIPASGSGLTGFVYGAEAGFSSIHDLFRLIARREPERSVAVECLNLFPGRIPGPKGASARPEGLAITGYVYIPPGRHVLTVVSGDAFALNIGGMPYLMAERPGPATIWSREGDFAGGLHDIDLVCACGVGSAGLILQLNGQPIAASAFHQSVEEFIEPTGDVTLVPASDYPGIAAEEAADLVEEVSAARAPEPLLLVNRVYSDAAPLGPDPVSNPPKAALGGLLERITSFGRKAPGRPGATGANAAAT